MKRPSYFGLVFAGLLALFATIGFGTAAATELYKNTQVQADKIGVNRTIEATLETGSSLLLTKTGSSTPFNTCTGSEASGKLESAGGEGAIPVAKLSTLTFTGCFVATVVDQAGSLKFENISGTTNSKVSSANTQVTVWNQSTGSFTSCNTGENTQIGTATGTSQGAHAVMHINAVINCGFALPSAVLQGTYRITTPTGLIAESASKSGTELYENTYAPNDTLGSGTELKSSLEGSWVASRTDGSFVNTCTGSEFIGEVESAGGNSIHPTGRLSGLTFTGCTRPNTVLTGGGFEIKSASSTNGTVTSWGTEVKVGSPFGTLTCVTGGGTDLGTLTGAAKEGHATLDISAVINCGFLVPSAILNASYAITSPTGLIVEAS